MARRVRIDLAYDGTSFSGWQIQPGRPTIQGALEEALARVQGGARAAVRGAGRTDAGVHARGQVADAGVTTRLSDLELLRALRALLPPAVAIRSLREVDEGFHARRSATAKTYAYLVDRSAPGDPFLARFALHAPGRMDAGAIDEALASLPGTRDFRGFSAADTAVEDRVRTLTGAERVTLRDGLEAFRFTADGFLMHMVRILTGTLLEIGRGRFGPERIAEVLLSGERSRAGPTAPPHGLTLARVVYPEEAGGASGGDGPVW